MDAFAAGHNAAVQMIDTSVVRVHQHGARIAATIIRIWVVREARTGAASRYRSRYTAS
jgi:hypothetical protein